MKTVRAHVFETNSSSAHSITFSSQFPGNQTDGKLLVTGDGDFGWGYEELATPTEKMNYALIAYAYICSGEEECEQVLSEIKRVFATYGVEVIFEGEYDGKQQVIRFEVDDWDVDGVPSAHTNGYIDHQSTPNESDDCERLAKMFRDDPDELYGFVYGDASIIIDNDNN